MFADFRVHGLNKMGEALLFLFPASRCRPVVKALEKGLVQPMYAKVREHGAPVQWARLGGEQESEDAIGASTAPRDDKKGVSSVVVSHSSPKAGLTPISCHAELERSACAPFIKERRMECINATSLHRKSGPWGTQRSFVRKRILLQIAVDASRRRCRRRYRLPGRCPRNRCRCWSG